MAAGREDEPKGRLELYRRLGGPDAGRGARRLPPSRPADDRAADAAPGPAATDVLPRGRRPPAPRHRLARRGARPARLLVGQPLAGLRPRWSLHRPPRRDRSRSLYRVERLAGAAGVRDPRGAPPLAPAVDTALPAPR